MASIYPNFVIQKIDIDEVVAFDNAKFNSNNHWLTDAEGFVVAPDDYKEKVEASNTKYWVDKFRTDYKKIIIDDPSELAWMIAASRISSKTGKFTNLYQDEMDEFLKVNEPKYSEIFNKTGYFVRSENVSFKYGQHGVGPYYCLKQILESAISCIEGHKPLHDNTQFLTLYLLDWVNINHSDEYRVFVCNNQITAISQQYLHSVFDGLNNDEQNIERLRIMYDYFENNIKNEFSHLESYSYDFAILNGQTPYFIELNSFGKEYAAGSALFHWLLDEAILYGKNSGTIYFRHTIRTINDKV